MSITLEREAPEISPAIAETPALQPLPELYRRQAAGPNVAAGENYVNLQFILQFINDFGPKNIFLSDIIIGAIFDKNGIYYKQSERTEGTFKLLDIFVSLGAINTSIEGSLLFTDEQKEHLLITTQMYERQHPDGIISHTDIIALNAVLASSEDTSREGVVGRCADFLASKIPSGCLASPRNMSLRPLGE